MCKQMRKNEAIVGRTDIYYIDPVKIVVQDGFNPRSSFDAEKLEDLKNSIIANGVRVPLIVKYTNDEKFVLIDGERRLRATLMAINEGTEIVSVPCRVERKTMNEIDMLALAMTANESERLTPLEEGRAFARLRNYNLSIQEISKKMGKSYNYVQSRLSLIDASPEIQKQFEQKNITFSEVKEIVENSDGIESQKEQLEKVIEKREERKAKIKANKAKAVYDKKQWVEVSEEMFEWLVELNKEQNIEQVKELLIKVQKMLDQED